MQKYQNNVTNRAGDAVRGLQVTVNVAGGGLATIYSDNVGTVRSNPLTTDASGYFEFYAADGRYNITVPGGGYTDVMINDTLVGINGAVKVVDLAASTGATLVGTTAGTVQSDLNARPTTAALAAADGSAGIGFEQAGTGAIARALEEKAREVAVSVKDYGAIGNGVTDDTAAFQKAIAYLATLSSYARRRLLLPGGNYLVSHGVFSYNTGAQRTGITFVGDGIVGTTLTLKSDGATQGWFYDNGGTAISDRNRFEHIRFLGQDKAFCNGFKLTDSTGAEKLFEFGNCLFDDLTDVLSCNGTTNTDQVVYLACEWRNVGTLLRLNNTQAVCYQYFGCNGWFTSDLIVVDAGGGGDVTYVGGSIVNLPAGGIDTHLIKANSPVTSVGAGSFNFNGVRVESRTANAKLVNWLATTAPNTSRNVRITFNSCNLSQALQGSGVTRAEAVKIGAGKSVSFVDCVLPIPATGSNDDFAFVIDALESSASVSANPGTIRFERTSAGANLRDKCTLVGSYGYFGATDMTCLDVPGTDASRRALDFSFGWVNGNIWGNTSKVKYASIKRTAWPRWNGAAYEQESTIELPAGAIIARVKVYKPAQGVSSASTIYYIGTDDKAVIYGQSVSARQDALHTIDAAVIVAATTAGQKVRLWADGTGALNQSGGYAIVEYV
jgi:hypothetical protein